MRYRATSKEARCARVLKYHPARLVPRLAAPPIPGGELFGGRHIFLGITRPGSKAVGWRTVAATRLLRHHLAATRVRGLHQPIPPDGTASRSARPAANPRDHLRCAPAE